MVFPEKSAPAESAGEVSIGANTIAAASGETTGLMAAFPASNFFEGAASWWV